MKKIDDTWNSSDPYEYFMGRWSTLIAPEFLDWLNAPHHLAWLDVGCGTGALSEAIYRKCQPATLCCMDPSAGFLEKAKERLSGAADFIIGDASHIQKVNHSFDIVVSGLALNFFPDLTPAFSEMKRVLREKGTIAAYVWDYADRMEFLRLFWDAACALDPDARNLDEGVRFPICHPNNLSNAFEEAGLKYVATTYLQINTIFRNFDDYWNPFLGGQGPAPGYLASLPEQLQQELKAKVQKKLPFEKDGSIRLLARAIAVQGKI
ncbi:MAG: methyltransferase domain-containing protein [Flavisolibacter sp.]|nr:methyltransferase domain-containing protein [Flavisolibacter sp.]